MKTKVDGITLLQMIKDGKLKGDTRIQILNEGEPTNIFIRYVDGDIVWNPGEFWVSQLYNDDFMFEIENKPKKIENISIVYNKTNQKCALKYANTFYELTSLEVLIVEKLEETIKAVNYLLEKEK